jgi:ribonuclease Y
MIESGEQAAFEANVGRPRPRAVKILGRLKYRTSYGQNVLAHSVECAHLAAMMADELGASAKTARRAALLHDIGKAVSHEIEGPHALVGGDLARRTASRGRRARDGGPPQRGRAADRRGRDRQAADALSGARPGARGESLEQYVKRLRDLEQIATRHDGVDKVYAMQAGREIRVMVLPGALDDDGAVLLSHEIAREIEQELEYPGQIKVTVIRESRATTTRTGTSARMKRFHVTTFGCQMNEHDSERMKGMLESLGYAEAPAREDADLILFNTCSIREKADERFVAHLHEARL